MTDELPERESPEAEEPEAPRRYVITSLGGFLELPPVPEIDYEELARRAREASPSERIEAARRYLLARYADAVEPTRVFRPWLPYSSWDKAVYPGEVYRDEDGEWRRRDEP